MNELNINKKVFLIGFIGLYIYINVIFAFLSSNINVYFFSFLSFSSLLLTFFVGLFFVRKPSLNNEFKKISVIVAARNEENNISKLLDAISKQNYPIDKYELIVCNDRSEDNTQIVLEEWQRIMPNLKIIKVKESDEKIIRGKKNAILQGIEHSSYEYLAFTDADCIPPENWLREIDKHFTEEIDYIAGFSPLFRERPSFLEDIKNMERISIAGITAGGIGINWGISCSARNMAYKKSLFYKVEGFKGIGHILSGDDDLLMYKMRKVASGMTFMYSKDSIVPALDNISLEAQINQETRRSSKFIHYPFDIKLLTLFVMVFFVLNIVFFGKIFVKYIPNSHIIHNFLMLLMSEFLLVSTIIIKLRKFKLLKIFPLFIVLYIPYYIIFGIKGTFGKYVWK